MKKLIAILCGVLALGVSTATFAGASSDASGLEKVTAKKTNNTATSVSVPAAWLKARTLNGIATRAVQNACVGTFSVKCGKANARTGIAKISAVYTPFEGKKVTYKAQNVKVDSAKVLVSWGGFSVTIEGNEFYGGEELAGGLSVESADVGGAWTKTDGQVFVNTEGATFPAGTFTELLPDGEPVIPSGGKWAFHKAAKVKLSKDKTKVVVDTTGGKTNLSAMKLTYTPKTGLFKGSYKGYAYQNKKLVKFMVKVMGVVVNEEGVGLATLAGSAPMRVTVECGGCKL